MGEEQLFPEEVKEVILDEIDGLPLESYTETIDGATMIRDEVGRIVEGLNKTISYLKSELSLSNRSNEHLNEKCDELTAANYEQATTIIQLTLERDQALLYRDNAAKQLEDMAQELETSRIELNRSREVKAYTEAERTAQAEEARQRLINSRIKIYNVQWEDDIRQVTKLCYIAETGEPHTFNYLERGKYTEITEEEALAIQAMNKPVEIPEVESQEEFRSEDTSLPDIQQGTEQEDSAEQREAMELEPETFEERTERRLNAIEHRLNKNEPEFVHDIAS